MLDLSDVKPLKDEPYPFTELQEKCIRDLETTEESQASGRLEKCDAEGKTIGFCCLGRFCVVAGAKRITYQFADSVDVEYVFEGATEQVGIMEPLKKLLSLNVLGDFKQLVSIPGKGSFYSLANMNDSKNMSFKEIAQYMRHDPWNVFCYAPVEAPNA